MTDSRVKCIVRECKSLARHSADLYWGPTNAEITEDSNKFQLSMCYKHYDEYIPLFYPEDLYYPEDGGPMARAVGVFAMGGYEVALRLRGSHDELWPGVPNG